MAEAKNERLWFKTNMKLANLWVSLKDAGKAAKVCLEGGGAEGRWCVRGQGEWVSGSSAALSSYPTP